MEIDVIETKYTNFELLPKQERYLILRNIFNELKSINKYYLPEIYQDIYNELIHNSNLFSLKDDESIVDILVNEKLITKAKPDKNGDYVASHFIKTPDKYIAEGQKYKLISFKFHPQTYNEDDINYALSGRMTMKFMMDIISPFRKLMEYKNPYPSKNIKDVIELLRTEYYFSNASFYIISQLNKLAIDHGKTTKLLDYNYDYKQTNQIKHLVKKIKTDLDITIPTNNHSSVINTLFTENIYQLYALCKLKPKLFDKELLNSKKKITYYENFRDFKTKQKIELSKNAIYLYLIGKLLGNDRANQIEESYKKELKPILSYLKPREKEIVENEQKRLDKLSKLISKNSCPHLNILAELRYNKNYKNTISSLAKLKKYAPAQWFKSNEILKCKNCKLDLICPHLLTMYETTLESRDDYINTGEKLQMRLKKYLDNIVINNAYHCNICGERIKNRELFDSGISNSKDEVDEYSRNIIISQILVAMKYIMTKEYIASSVISNYLVDETFYEYFKISSKIERENMSDDLIKDKLELYAFIIIIAILCNVILDKGFISFTPISKETTGGKEDQSLAIIRQGLQIIIHVKKASITALPNIDGNFIKNKLIEYFKIYRDGSIKINYTQRDAFEDYIKYILVDSFIYQYIYSINTLNQIKNPVKRNDLQYYLGHSPKELYEKQIIFSNARIPDKYLSLYQKLKETPIDKFDPKMIHDKEPIFKNLIEKVNYLAFYDFYYHVVEQKEETIGIYIKLFDIIASNAKKNYHIIPIWNYIFVKKNYNIKSNIGKKFGDDGHLHKFDIYVYGNKELTIKEIIDLQSSGKFGELYKKPFDKKCSICNKYLSKLTNKGVKDALLLDIAKKGFFNNFSIKCPEVKNKTGFHVWDNSVCKYCGIKYGEKSDKYFNKYAHVKLDDGFNFTFKKPPQQKKEKITYKFNSTNIVQMSKTLKINYYNIAKLGFSEGKSYDDFKKMDYEIGKYDEGKEKTRSYTLNRHMLKLISDINQINNIKFIMFPPEYLKDFKSKKINIKININYRELYTKYVGNIKYYELNNFILDEICKIGLELYKLGGEVKKYAEYYFNYILKYDVYTSKPEDYSAFYKVKDIDQQEIDEMGDELLSEGSDNKDFKFSYDGFDYDGHNEGDGE
jgi:hypothetical protein